MSRFAPCSSTCSTRWSCSTASGCPRCPSTAPVRSTAGRCHRRLVRARAPGSSWRPSAVRSAELAGGRAHRARRLTARWRRRSASPLLFRHLGLEPDAAAAGRHPGPARRPRARAGAGGRVPAPITARCSARCGPGHRLAVVSTSTTPRRRWHILERAGVARPVRAGGGLGRRGLAQAAPADLRDGAAAASASRPGQALFVGDRADIDVVGAQGMGMPGGLDQPRRATPLPAGQRRPIRDPRPRRAARHRPHDRCREPALARADHCISSEQEV